MRYITPLFFTLLLLTGCSKSTTQQEQLPDELTPPSQQMQETLPSELMPPAFN